eukprot:TRINITY_DN25477_c0_g1_i1.p1 TRINITY_DN25477_c0_g1~~TRINITY_DN25477_c0_g1_i1.p1  ORF type:complete len:168 (-),score=23.16 TRINITY_DN25477_c0_g1_i1:37-540(-)
MWSHLNKFGKVLAILIIIFSVIYLIETVPYYVAIGDEIQNGNTNVMDMFLWILSAVVLFCIAGCGLWGSFKSVERCLLVFAVASIVMWIFSLIQMVIIYLTLKNCDSPLFSNNPWQNVCTQTLSDMWYWIPTIILMFVNACAAFAACGMRHFLLETSQDGGLGEFYG